MNTCCPKCASPSAIGSDAATICAECLHISAIGSSVPISLLTALTLVAGVLLVYINAARTRGLFRSVRRFKKVPA